MLRPDLIGCKFAGIIYKYILARQIIFLMQFAIWAPHILCIYWTGISWDHMQPAWKLADLLYQFKYMGYIYLVPLLQFKI